MLKTLMLNGKKGRRKGQIFSIQPNKYMSNRLMLKRKQRRLKEGDEEEVMTLNKLPDEILEEDKMSKLPDEVLVSIMCLMTTEEAARVSMVCRRWNKIWKSTIPITPRLSFVLWNTLKTKWGRNQTDEMIDVVNRLTKLHKAPTLDEFAIGFTLKSLHSQHINTWFDFAAKKQVKKLSLEFAPRFPSCNTLLLKPYDATFLADNYPMYWLRDLYIQGMYVPEIAIHRLLSNSPFLERFSVVDVYQNKLKIVPPPNLKFLKISQSAAHTNLQYIEISSSSSSPAQKNDQNLTLDIMEMEIHARHPSSANININISAPNLSYLILSLWQNFKFDSYRTLLPQIKRLHLRIFSKVLIEMPADQIPEFSKLEHLHFEMVYTSFSLPIHRLPDLLKAPPFLSTISFSCNRGIYEDNRLKPLDKRIPEKVEANGKNSCQNGKHSYQYLKMVKLDNFDGCKYEVELVFHLLKYAVAMEKIIIQLLPSGVWKSKNNWACEDNQYENFCVGCAQLLKTQILQMYPSVDVILT